MIKHTHTPQALLLAALCLAPPAVLAQAVPALQSEVDTRTEAIVSRLTLDEQLGLLKSLFPAFQKKILPADALIGAGYIPGIERVGLPSLRETDAGMGVANLLNARKDDVATSMPSMLAVAAAWDPQLAYAGGAMIGAEARAKGFNVLLAGGVNLIRDARTGRNFEYPGEDPLLAGVMAGHAIAGVQSNHILSTVKHYAMNDQETGRNVLNAKIGEAAMRESDLLAFQLAIEIGKPAAVMCAYNRVNSVYACENEFLLNTVLKGDWKYPGWVQSDWGSVHSTAAAANAGLDHQSGYILDRKPYFGELLKTAVQDGEVPRERIRDMSYRIVRSTIATGLLDHPVTLAGQAIDYAANALVSERAASAGIVLLKNAGGVLPIAGGVRSIAVIGGHADIGVLSGGGSSQVRPVGGPALEIKPPGNAAAFARITYFPSSPLKALERRYPKAAVAYASGEDIGAAVELASKADLTIIFGEQWTTESEDVPSLDLPGRQNELIDAVASASRRTVVVLQTGGPVSMPWKDKAAAIVAAWYPGSAGGKAIVNVLSGDNDAAGRLPVTFPASVEQLPRPTIPGLAAKTSAKGEIVYGLASGLKEFDVDYDIEGSDVGYRWFARQQLEPLFAFGHGLSYTRFSYQQPRFGGADGLTLTFKVSNVGRRAGVDTPQVYAAVPGRDGKPVQRLAGWARVALKPGESKWVKVRLEPRVLANYDTALRKWVIPGGTCKVAISRSATAPVLGVDLLLKERQLAP
ncbi:beta-glucosidase [Oxalobacteraceae bacterium A2-2]